MKGRGASFSTPVSVLVPNWNGRHLLESLLPVLLVETARYGRETGCETEVVVVDDGSSDGSVAFLLDRYPRSVKAVHRRANGGFPATCNTGLLEVRHPVVVLLNNDVVPSEGFIPPLVRHFGERDVFAVTCRSLVPGTLVTGGGGTLGRYRRGFWSLLFNYAPSIGTSFQARDGTGGHPWISAVASGGCSAFNAEKMRELGGFLQVYNPFYWEDADISYRAWKRGWRVLYEPESAVSHHAGTTIGDAHRAKFIRRVSFRNRLMFHWINVHDRRMFLSHVFWLSLRLLTEWAAFRGELYGGFRDALSKLAEVRVLRAREKRLSVVGDRAVRERFRAFSESHQIRVIRNIEDAERMSREKPAG